MEVLLEAEFSLQSRGISSKQCKIRIKLEMHSIIAASIYLDNNVLIPEVLNLFNEMTAM